jgi:hypothetical protein
MVHGRQPSAAIRGYPRLTAPNRAKINFKSFGLWSCSPVVGGHPFAAFAAFAVLVRLCVQVRPAPIFHLQSAICRSARNPSISKVFKAFQRKHFFPHFRFLLSAFYFLPSAFRMSRTKSHQLFFRLLLSPFFLLLSAFPMS